MAATPLRQFKSLAKKGASLPSDLRLRKQMALGSVTQTGDRRLKFTISTGAVDRDSDTLSPEGWDLDEYRQNPVVLFAHDAQHFPIGKSVNVDVTDGALVAEVEFVPADTPCAGERAEAVYQMCIGGFLSAASVGFHPVEFEFSSERQDDFGIDFKRQKLLEWSIVTVPANPEALIEPLPAPDDSVIQVTDQEATADTGPKSARHARIRALDYRARAAAV